ncbi:DUF2075 domain-containing protein [Spirosoma taeanense]|uniref:DUF2075 domain-containing protein n=1 Tax=Spirosoma taeanense TaxID=2735870 RepID=A0A6M5Y5Y8_9BACT|nr:DUF2075 domain-containing protein [Spirosoma taeanense]QJW89235.1 DUF2075 domain-containing protein [Spirosoma taeanense]
MRLYSGTTAQFIKDSTLNQIADKLKLAFFNYYRYNPSPNELNSWRNSLRATSQVLQHANLTQNGILLEYQLPLSSKRLDAMICGKDSLGNDNAVILELKQWDHCNDSDGANEVMTFLGGAKRDVLHPSAQVGQYKAYLEDSHTAFYEGNKVSLSACSYLHNYSAPADDVLFSDKFTSLLQVAPVFTGDHVEELSDYLKTKLDEGDGERVLGRIEESKYRPSKKLMEHVGQVIKGQPQYVLLDEQLVVYDRVYACAKKGFHDKRKSVVIVKGGPGTGKSVVAINLLADLYLKDQFNAQYATGSKAFTETLREVIGKRGASQFKYFNSYTQAEYNEIDVLICDEAHRIRKTSNNMYTPAAKRSDVAQIEEIINVAKVAVFFIDDNQIVRPDEIGSVRYIKEYAQKNECSLFEFELEAQFRCNGSDGFVNWINNTLGIQKTANVIWDNKEAFDFRIMSSPEALEQAIHQKVDEGYTARMTAGFCWPWSLPDTKGNLVNDVTIGSYQRPWNAKPDAKKLAKDIPRAPLWAYDKNGINQVGCIYTAQGFEFDYVGVIFGQDLVYRFDKGGWIANKEASFDTTVKRSRDQFVDLVKNTYRVLLSRGMKGCYVYFLDKETALLHSYIECCLTALGIPSLTNRFRQLALIWASVC